MTNIKQELPDCHFAFYQEDSQKIFLCVASFAFIHIGPGSGSFLKPKLPGRGNMNPILPFQKNTKEPETPATASVKKEESSAVRQLIFLTYYFACILKEVYICQVEYEKDFNIFIMSITKLGTWKKRCITGSTINSKSYF